MRNFPNQGQKQGFSNTSRFVACDDIMIDCKDDTNGIEPALSQTASLDAATVPDTRFRNLLSAHDWEALPSAIRRRFSKKLAGGATVIYAGMIDKMSMSLPGRVLAQFLRIIGAPLPLEVHTGVPSIVSVTEDIATGGQIWTRLYGKRRSFPQIIQSSKRFAGPTGLEEYIGYGVTMALKPRVSPTALIFESAGYSIGFGTLRIALPACLAPGHVTVSHEEITPETFRFTLELRHPMFGMLIEQSGIFREERL